MTFILFTLLVALIWFIFILLFPGNKSRNNYSINFKYGYEVNRKRKNYQSKTYLDRGYLRFKDSDKYVHRWVMEKHLGRHLSYQEVVHHIDGDKLNNRIENLRLFKDQNEHNNHHLNNLRISGDWYEKEPDYIYYRNLLTYVK